MELKGLTDFQRDLMRTSKNTHREIPKILRKVGSKGRTVVARKARARVKKKTGNYHKKFKRGKVFKVAKNEWITRVINSARHAHLIEEGHKQVAPDGSTIGFVRGKYPLRDGMNEFESSGVPDEMYSEWIDGLLKENKL